jgi:hypothetical protein
MKCRQDLDDVRALSLHSLIWIDVDAFLGAEPMRHPPCGRKVLMWHGQLAPRCSSFQASSARSSAVVFPHGADVVDCKVDKIRIA